MLEGEVVGVTLRHKGSGWEWSSGSGRPYPSSWLLLLLLLVVVMIGVINKWSDGWSPSEELPHTSVVVQGNKHSKPVIIIR